jgi:hypothetical protein
MILRNGKFSGKILRKIFRMGKFCTENFPPHITIHMSVVQNKRQSEENVTFAGSA